MQTHRAENPSTKSPGLKKLEDCLRSELSAVETYELAIKGVNHVGIRHTLQEILASHLQRTSVVRDKIHALGAEAPTSSGIWGAFAKAVQAGADLLGDRAAIAALEDGEDRALKLYTEAVQESDEGTRQFIETELLPQQEHTHQLCRTLKNYMRSAS